MKTIILLHGAIGSSEQLIALSKILIQKGFKTELVNFSGHGKKPFQNNFSILQFSSELKLFIDENKLVQPHVFGYSMGGYVALQLSKQDPQLLGNIITLGTKFNWTKEIAEKEIKNLDPELIEKKVPKFADWLKQIHGDDWKMLLQRTAQMMTGLGEKNTLSLGDFEEIKNNVLIGLADNDQMVTLVETVSVHKQLPNGGMFMLPNSKHPIETVNVELLAEIISDFVK